MIPSILIGREHIYEYGILPSGFHEILLPPGSPQRGSFLRTACPLSCKIVFSSRLGSYPRHATREVKLKMKFAKSLLPVFLSIAFIAAACTPGAPTLSDSDQIATLV